MNAIKQKCRPQHQVLILKCYPRTTKGAVDVKPNSSELSYLLFYATSRRSKIQKIGAFLEKKTASDVWRMRIGNVQVTLGILAALVEKSPKDVVLIAPCILKILDLILRSNDITMVESSLPTFDAFCEHHDPSSLFADQAYLHQYEAIVRAYAQLASTRHFPGKAPVSLPVQMRWRSAGLGAIKSLANSDALSSLTGRQVHVIVPMILENLWTDNDDFLEVLLQRVQMEEKVDTEKLLRRRTSVATVRTAETGGDTNPVALVGTALDVDKMAEEDIGVLAMQCLKSIFVVPNRPQIHAATHALFRFIFERLSQGDTVVNRNMNPDGTKADDSGWAVKIYGIVARWAPVQDRFVVLVVAMDILAKTPIRDANLEQHVAIAAMIRSLLRSDVNLIGLSVMDVLLALTRHMRKLFRVSTGGSRSDSLSEEKADVETGPTNLTRLDLLERLEQAIGDLATHVYYGDQISDMITAIVSRIKPLNPSSTGSTPQGEKVAGNEAGPAASVADLGDGHSSAESYFSYKAGRVSALKAIRAILLVANPKTKLSGSLNLSRNRVPVEVWEGTQWLLRDPDGQVRKAYVNALVTWLNRETTPTDTKARDPGLVAAHGSLKNSRELSQISSTRRAVSNASNRERPTRVRHSQFLPLLHVAIYDSALRFVEYDNDIVLLHVLLTKLVFKLGVNSVRYGVPMVYRLQEEIQEVEVPIHKVRIAALCHGYFWALTEKFDFEASVVGRAITNEVVRRRSKGFWVEGIHIPTPSVDSIGAPGQARPQPNWDLSALEREELLPFDDRSSLVECIATSYEESSKSPPASPAVSPGRGPANPILGSGLGHMANADVDHELPSVFRQQMLTDWSREGVIEALALEGKPESLSGSKTTGTTKNRLTITTAGLNGNGHLPSPYGSAHNLRPHSARILGELERQGTLSKLRKTSIQSGITPSTSMAGKAGIASVDQLKQVLSGNLSPTAVGFPAADDDTGSSMVSYEYTPSETSFNPASQPEQPPIAPDTPLKRSLSASRRGPLALNPPGESAPNLQIDEEDADGVPPVPPLPSLGSLSGRNLSYGGDISVQDYGGKTARRSLNSRGGESVSRRSVRAPDESGRGVDLQDLLRGIDSRSGEGSLGNLTKPPY